MQHYIGQRAIEVDFTEVEHARALARPLLSKDTSNAKLAKTFDVHGQDWSTWILYLAPAEVAVDGVNLCPASTDSCRKDCLFFQGRARMFKEVNEARIRKTKLLLTDPIAFYSKMHKEIQSAIRTAQRKGKRVAFRLDGTSDIGLGVHFARVYPEAQFYDYTKTARAMNFARGSLPSNYHVTFSRSDTNSGIAARVLRAGGNVALVVDSNVKVDFSNPRLLDGDKHDARFLDGRSPDGLVVVLKAKGSLKGQGTDTGFCLTQAGFDAFLAATEKVSELSKVS
jgi:hypothetical protein